MLYIDEILCHDNLESIQAVLCCATYSLRSSKGTSHWYVALVLVSLTQTHGTQEARRASIASMHKLGLSSQPKVAQIDNGSVPTGNAETSILERLCHGMYSCSYAWAAAGLAFTRDRRRGKEHADTILLLWLKLYDSFPWTLKRTSSRVRGYLAHHDVPPLNPQR